MITHRAPISGIAAHRDQYVLTAGYDNQVILWDAKTQRPLARAMHDHLANQGAFSPDGAYVVTSSSDYSARLWTVPDLRLVAVFADQEDDVEMSVFHPDKPLVATASRDHRVRVYDFGGKLLHTFSGHTADVISVEWMRGADEIVSSSDDGTIKRWSLANNGLVADIDLDGIETDTIAIAADGRIFAGNDEGEIISIGVDGARATIAAHDAGVKRLVLDGERGLLVSLSYDRTMRLWKAGAAGEPRALGGAALPPEVWPRSCSFEGDEHIVFSTFHSSYRRYNWKTERWDAAELPPTHGVNAVQPVDGHLWTIGDAGIVRVDQREHARTGSLCNFLAPAGELILTGGQLGKVFDARSGRELHQHRSPLNCGVAFARDGAAHAVIGTQAGRRHRAADRRHAGDARGRPAAARERRQGHRDLGRSDLLGRGRRVGHLVSRVDARAGVRAQARARQDRERLRGPRRRLLRVGEPRSEAADLVAGLSRGGDRDTPHAFDQVRRGECRRPLCRHRQLQRPRRRLRPRRDALGARRTRDDGGRIVARV